MNMLEGMPQRQAALLLHALSEPDRAWVLSALPEQDHAQLTALLQELRDMNVSPDPSWLVQWLPPAQAVEQGFSHAKLREPSNAGTASPASQSHAELMALKPHQVSDLARLLSAEPVQLTLRLLRVQPWPWREKLLSQMSASAQMRLRQSLRDLTADSGMGPESSQSGYKAGQAVSRLDQALIDALARRMAKTTTVGALDDEAAKDGNQFLPASFIALWRNWWSTPARMPS